MSNNMSSSGFLFLYIENLYLQFLMVSVFHVLLWFLNYISLSGVQ